MSAEREPGSFRDSAGFVFYADGEVFRHVSPIFGETWDRFVSSGLFPELMARGLMVQTSVVPSRDPGAHVLLRATRVPTISYPYEWAFSQLKDAALLTLEAMRLAMEHGFWLRDATAYNVQFFGTKPILIDTLSFGLYEEGKAWPAYGQFCRHFLAPLALASKRHVGLIQLLRTHLDGVPLDLASRILPFRTKFDPGLAPHLHMHALAGGSAASKGPSGRPIPKNGILGMVDSLRRTVEGLKAPSGDTTWGQYYAQTNYTDRSFQAKRDLVKALLGEVSPLPGLIWDLGANSGVFSECAAEIGARVVAWDADPTAVELAYRKWKGEGRADLLPLLQDFSNPSPSQGWAHTERKSFAQRAPAEATMALALVHHLAIGNNVPLAMVSDWLTTLAPWTLVEFVPKADSQVQRMLSTREDIFTEYHEAGFEQAFADRWTIVRKERIPDTERTLYLFRCRS